MLYPKDKPAFQRPILQLAAVAMLVLMAYPFLFKSDLVPEKQQVAKVEPIKKEQTQKTDVVVKEKSITEPIEEVQPEQLVDLPLEAVAMDMKDAESDFIGGTDMFAGVAIAEPAISTHPDGIFVGASAITYSQPASAQPGVLDLLTATF